MGKRRSRARGKMTPPTAPPVAARPVAAPRPLLNQWAIADREGVKRREEPIPPKMERLRMKCQYSATRC